MTDAVLTQQTDTPKEPGPVTLVMTLVVAGFLSGLLLVLTYLGTKPYIEQNKARALKTAIYKVLPGCKQVKPMKITDQNLVLLEDPNEKTEEVIYAGYDESNQLIGFAIPGGEAGFQDIISVIYGYKPESKTIIGFEVLDSKETPGLGDKIIKDQNWLNNFKALNVEPEILSAKPGEKSKSNEVETITGATISSKAVIRLLQKSVAKWKPVIDSYIQKEGR
jgi:electron transport complex protein RnfG